MPHKTPVTCAKSADLIEEAANDLLEMRKGQSKKSTFDMGEWGRHVGKHPPKEHNYCGTAACAAGWLSLHPKWRRRGFISHWFRSYADTYYLVGGKDRKHETSWQSMTEKVFGSALLYNAVFTGRITSDGETFRSVVSYMKKISAGLRKHGDKKLEDLTEGEEFDLMFPD